MRHYCASEELSLVDVVKLLRSLLASKRGDAAGGSPEITAVEDRFSSVLAGELGKWSVVIHHIEYTASLGSVFGSAVVRMSCDTRHMAEKLICVVGTSAGVPVTRAEMESSLARMTKELSETIKAVIDAKFGELGPAGVLAIEDCVQKLKAAMDQFAGVATTSGSGADQVVPAVPPVQLEESISPVAVSSAASFSPSQLSDVPTAFGGVRSLVSTGGGAATSSKPGKESQKIMGGVLVTVPKLKAYRRLHTFFFEVNGGLGVVASTILGCWFACECVDYISASEESEDVEAFILCLRRGRDFRGLPPTQTSGGWLR